MSCHPWLVGVVVPPSLVPPPIWLECLYGHLWPVGVGKGHLSHLFTLFINNKSALTPKKLNNSFLQNIDVRCEKFCKSVLCFIAWNAFYVLFFEFFVLCFEKCFVFYIFKVNCFLNVLRKVCFWFWKEKRVFEIVTKHKQWFSCVWLTLRKWSWKYFLTFVLHWKSVIFLFTLKYKKNQKINLISR